MTPLDRSLFALDGQVALITGAASGIGKATAIAMSAAGARVAVADIDIEGANSTAIAIDGAIAFEFDLNDETSCERMVDEVVTQFGMLDILVNNAGIYPKYPTDALTEGDFQKMERVNVWGCFVVMRAAARAMRQAGRGGRIINVSSIGAARTAVDHQLAYNASKAAMDSMTQSAARDWAADGILVNSVRPGGVLALDSKPKPAHHIPPTGPLQDAGRVLLGRWADPGEVVGPILMLASPAGGYITGQALIIDGGFSVS